jgi:hypothetical protein
MSKLAEFQKQLADIRTRGDNFLSYMEVQNNNFFHPMGAWGRLREALTMLSERLQHLNAPNAGDPAAANDVEVMNLLGEIAHAKAQCIKASDEFWVTARRVEAVANEVKTLQEKIEGVIKEKKATSKTVGGLSALSKELTTYRNELKTACLTGPHKTTHPLLQ